MKPGNRGRRNRLLLLPVALFLLRRLLTRMRRRVDTGAASTARRVKNDAVPRLGQGGMGKTKGE